MGQLREDGGLGEVGYRPFRFKLKTFYCSDLGGRPANNPTSLHAGLIWIPGHAFLTSV